MTIMDLWVREKTVVGVENLVAFCGHIFFLVRSTGLHVELSSMPPLVFVAVEYDIVHQSMYMYCFIILHQSVY